MVRINNSDTTCTGVILSGGLNKRFAGQNKAFIDFGNRRVIDNIYDVFKCVFDEIILVTNQPMAYLEWDVNIVTDIYPVRSSLTGIHTGLFYARHPFIFVTACDTPFLKKEMVETVVSHIEPGAAVVIPETADGTEQLCAAYSKTCLSLMERQIKEEKFQIKKMFRKVRVKKIPETVLRRNDPELMSFFNINTVEDYSKAKQWLEQHQNHT
ncbi:MAG: molybdenum cofactor guanylyltransferase [Desulfobacteraceae bacterium]|nr:molybdenum cofactor guanylyltransferase [Desulfobacteraceae bacterium]MBC2757626.1 molybdenum cofactor guanylyltransferase [Desulfobacteraceae bacterium]